MITYQKHYSGDEYYYRNISLFNFSIVPHMHEYSELTYVKKGKIKVVLNNKFYILKEGDLLLITQNQIHSYDTIDNSEIIIFMLGNGFFNLVFPLLSQQQYMPYIYYKENENLIDKLKECYKEEKVLINSYINLIGHHFINNLVLDTNETSKEDITLSTKVISYLSSNFKNPVSLKNISKEFGYNEKYLSSTLYNFTKTRFNDLLASYRVAYVKNKISQIPNIKINVIAFEAGFESLNTFNRQFKKITGMTPSAYKNLKNK